MTDDPTTVKVSPERRAHDYLHNVLNVDGPFDAAREASGVHDSSINEMLLQRANRRDLEELIADREMYLYGEHRPNFESQSAFDKGIKPILQADSELRDLRSQHRAAQDAHDRAEETAHKADLAMRLYSARMTELGGITSYLAAVKASKANQANQPEEASQDV